jgi:hypothetical protein
MAVNLNRTIERETLKKFSPYFVEFFRKAAVERVELRVGPRSKAQYLRKRLNMFRKALEQNGHELYASAATVTVSIGPASDQDRYPNDWSIFGDRRDIQFEDAFKEAGLKPNSDEMSPDLMDLFKESDDEK